MKLHGLHGDRCREMRESEESESEGWGGPPAGEDDMGLLARHVATKLESRPRIRFGEKAMSGRGKR